MKYGALLGVIVRVIVTLSTKYAMSSTSRAQEGKKNTYYGSNQGHVGFALNMIPSMVSQAHIQSLKTSLGRSCFG